MNDYEKKKGVNVERETIRWPSCDRQAFRISKMTPQDEVFAFLGGEHALTSDYQGQIHMGLGPLNGNVSYSKQ